MIHVLLVDDNSEQTALLKRWLEREEVAATEAHSAEEALTLIRSEPKKFSVIFSDIRMGQMTGVEMCNAIQDIDDSIPVILMTAFGDMESAIQALRANAFDFLSKPVTRESFLLSFRRARRIAELQLKLREQDDSSANQLLIGASPGIRNVKELIARLARTNVPVLVTGESGSGKEVVAKSIHQQSQAQGEFVAVNCAALPEALLESELFGHEKGAFTDAKTRKEGLFTKANDGTLFLDEIGEMPLPMQVKLLRALQEQVIRPVGSTTTHPYTARIIAATNKDIPSAIDDGLFREDLYYRIKVVEIEVPPLRGRGDDIITLAKHFLKKAANEYDTKAPSIAVTLAKKLLEYDWPGNVRELENCMRRLLALGFDELSITDLPEEIQNHRPDNLVFATNDAEALPTLEEVEERYIQKVMKTVGDNKSKAAEVLGIARKTLYRKLENHTKSSE